MAINDINEVLHRIRVKLYPNYLPKVEGAYIARTDSEASLTIEEVCAAGKSRGEPAARPGVLGRTRRVQGRCVYEP